MKLLFRLVLVWFFINAALPARCASILAVCKNFLKRPYDCNKNDIAFPTFIAQGNIMKYRIDRGALGEINETDAKNIAEDILTLWENESGLDFQPDGDGFIEEDVNEENSDKYFNNQKQLGYSPVIWDEQGNILENLYGKRSKENILGLASATFFSFDEKGPDGILEAHSLFNGYLFDGANVDEDRDWVLNTFKTTILHEFGHMFGLDHTQGGNNEGYNQYANGELDINELTDVPVMFPIIANPLVELQQDDIAAVRLGYPKGDENALFGKITGQLKQLNSGIKGANVVAFLVDDTNPRKKAVACPSDVDGNGEGNFTLPNLVPGTYIIKAEPLSGDFIGGSSVGIHNPIFPELMQPRFYMGEGIKSLASDDLEIGLNEALRINVSAGSTTNINFDLNLTSFKIKKPGLDYGFKLKKFKKRIISFTIRNYYPGQIRRLKISTDYPGLIEVLPSNEISFSKKFHTVRVRVASNSDFKTLFPEIEYGLLEIPITIEDLNTGYILDTESFWLF